VACEISCFQAIEERRGALAGAIREDTVVEPPVRSYFDPRRTEAIRKRKRTPA